MHLLLNQEVGKLLCSDLGFDNTTPFSKTLDEFEAPKWIAQ